MPVRRHAPVMVVPRHHTYSAPRHDYGIDESLSRADFLSNAVLEDTYDAASRSRNKDKDLLRNVNSAIAPKSEIPWYLERSARARSMALEHPAPPRAARGVSMPPVLALPPEPLPTARLKASTRRLPPALLRARARSLDRAGTPTPRLVRSASARGVHPASSTAPTQQLWAHRPAMLAKDVALAARARADPRNPYSARLRRAASEPRQLERGQNSHHSFYYPSLPASFHYYHRVPDVGERALSRHLYSHRGRFGPDSKPPRPSLANFPQVYVPWNGPGPSNRAKAAIIGSKMEPEGRASKRGPRSQFAQNKMREIRLDDLQRKYN